MPVKYVKPSSLVTAIAPALTTTTLKPGINSCTNAEYHQDRAYLSSSVIKTLYKSLDKYRQEYLEGKKTPYSERTLSTFAEGSYTHSRLLEPHLTSAEFALFPGWRKQGAEYETFKAENSNKTILSAPQVERCNNMIAAYSKKRLQIDLLQNGFSEQTLCGVLQDVPVKCRFDFINPEAGYIVDVKTTSYASDHESFKQTIKDFSYDLSAALYTQMAQEYYGKPFRFYFLVLSKSTFTCDIYLVSEQSQQKGAREVATGLNKFKRAAASGVWTESKPNTAIETGEYEVLEV